MPKLKNIPETLSLKIGCEGNCWFAECPELKLLDQGKSMLDATQNLFNMMYTSLVEAHETGNLEGMLQELRRMK